MSIAYFLELRGKTSGTETLPDKALEPLTHRLLDLPMIQTVDLFTPEPSHDPFLNDGSGPLLVVQMRFSDQQTLAQGLTSQVLTDALRILRNLPVDGGEIVQEALKLEHYPVSGEATEPGAVSYLVNYQRPADDELAFLKHYRAHHPPIMLQFPGLRSLELGLPIGWCPLEKFALGKSNVIL